MTGFITRLYKWKRYRIVQIKIETNFELCYGLEKQLSLNANLRTMILYLGANVNCLNLTPLFEYAPYNNKLNQTLSTKSEWLWCYKGDL